ncbi:Putative rRNA methylase [Clostridium cavendishii DSM 21758]|uniref:Putative rRNA methylase n=1 Tax=Clostridium cavendishii DSM 21758 TaxID=1121302 RepID=A0A1M6BDM4_9CLOT|nr:class I SAM-dependent methyltransferase [Clostridium cavendishii]SHI46842.1 Putative rRNA methylase [Clostridium cavendishii DSM 21758]
MNVSDLRRPTELAKLFLKGNIKNGDIVVDATMGNGNDTLFLSELVGNKGKVFSFDIQEIAILSTKKLLENNNVNNVELIQKGHENIGEYISEEIAAIMFNLGYLPKGDHTISTKAETTITAIEKGLKLLKKDGIITVIIYYGHEEGQIEKEKLLKYFETLDSKKFHVMKSDYINQLKQPPILITIIKK